MKLLFLPFLGVILLIVGLSNRKKSIKFRKNAVQTVATVRAVSKNYNFMSDSELFDGYKVLLKMQIYDKVYTRELQYSFFFFKKEGDTMKVYYNPENPEDFRTEQDHKYIISITLGITLLIISFLYSLMLLV